MKNTIITSGVVAIMIVALIGIVWKTAPTIGHESKDQTVIVTTQKGMVDSFNVNAFKIWLREGDLMYQNDTDYFHGNYKVIASGVYKFNTIQNEY